MHEPLTDPQRTLKEPWAAIERRDLSLEALMLLRLAPKRKGADPASVYGPAERWCATWAMKF